MVEYHPTSKFGENDLRNQHHPPNNYISKGGSYSKSTHSLHETILVRLLIMSVTYLCNGIGMYDSIVWIFRSLEKGSFKQILPKWWIFNGDEYRSK